jgi:hypothetical protein
VSGVSARRLVARALVGESVNVGALVEARRAYGSWNALYQALAEERLAALLAFRLGDQDLPGGERFGEDLRSRGRNVLAANLWRRKLFAELRGTLAAAGIPALPIKGVDVAFASFPSPSCRPMTDIDVLVSPDNYRAAQRVLRREGFIPGPHEPRWWPGRTFSRGGGEAVDLHWSPAAGLPPRRGMASLCYLGGNEKDLREEFRLLVSVCHHQNHFFSLPLLYFYETLLLARRVSWPRYWSLARRWSVVRVTAFVLGLARSFFGGESPAGKFGILKTLAARALSGVDPGRGARAAAVYAASLDNPAAAFAWGFRKPTWAEEVLTRGSMNGLPSNTKGKGKLLETA